MASEAAQSLLARASARAASCASTRTPRAVVRLFVDGRARGVVDAQDAQHVGHAVQRLPGAVEVPGGEGGVAGADGVVQDRRAPAGR